MTADTTTPAPPGDWITLVRAVLAAKAALVAAGKIVWGEGVQS